MSKVDLDETDLGKAIVRLCGLIDFEESETKQSVHEGSSFAEGSALFVEAEYMAQALCHMTYGGHEFADEQVADARKAATHWIGHVACLRGAGFSTVMLVGAFATRDRTADEEFAKGAHL